MFVILYLGVNRTIITTSTDSSIQEGLRMERNIAYCGLDCHKCYAYIATVNDDDDLRKKVAEEWSELNNVEITPEMINCVGCRADGVKTPFCQSMCEIRKCGMEKGYETCGDCSELDSCKKVVIVIGNNSDARENLKR